MQTLANAAIVFKPMTATSGETLAVLASTESCVSISLTPDPEPVVVKAPGVPFASSERNGPPIVALSVSRQIWAKRPSQMTGKPSRSKVEPSTEGTVTEREETTEMCARGTVVHAANL